MSTPQIYRIGAAILMVGAVLGVVSTVASPTVTDPREQLASPLWAPSQVLGIIAGLLTVVGLPAAYARMAGRAGTLGLIGFVALMVTGVMLGYFPFAVTLMLLPWLVNQSIPATELESGPESFFVYFTIASLIALAGALLFGLAIIRSRVYSRWPGYLLIGAGVFNLATTFLGDLPAPVWMASPVLFNLSLGWLGYELWRASRAVAEQVERREDLAA